MSTPIQRPGHLAADDPLFADQELAPGYRVRDHLSRGKVLDVYSVWSAERDCLCIAKALRPDRSGDYASGQQLRREGELLIRLAHPHLVRGYELVVEPPAQTPMVIMETLTGSTVSWLIETHGTPGLDPDDAVLMARQLCSVLHYLHRHQILHLDLKPSNIICQSGYVRLLDLSLAQSSGACPAGRGTLEYMAPEQLAGEIVTEASDVWGLGGVLYRAVTGSRPFARAPQAATENRKIDKARLAMAPEWLSRLISSCLAPAPGDRPSLDTLVAALDER